MRFVVLITICGILSYCAGGGVTSNISKSGFDYANQPVKVVENDDPFFKRKPEPNEIFRVLVTDDVYQVRQLGAFDRVKRKVDVSGDIDMHKEFLEDAQKINYKSHNFQGLLKVRMNVHTGEIEQLEFASNRNPKTWQSARKIQDDISRFQFEFTNKIVDPREFYIEYQWRIERPDGLSDEDAKKKAIEYLKTQTR